MSDGASVISSHTRRSSHQTLADQIYSRSLAEDTQSVVSCRTLDPPGADSQHLTEYLSEQYSDDDSSYDTFGDDQESYVELCDEDEDEFSVRSDPPNAITSSKSEVYEDSEDSENSDIEETMYSDESSCPTSGFDFDDEDDDDDDDDDNKYNCKMRLATDRHHLDVGGSPPGTSSGLVGRQNDEENSRKPTSRFSSSDISFEYDHEIGPPKRTSSFKAEKLASSAEPVRSKEISPPKRTSSFKAKEISSAEPVRSKGNDSTVIDQEESSLESPRNWLAQQISRQKTTGLKASSNSLDPGATKNEPQSHSLEPTSTIIEPQNDASSRNSEFDSDLEEFAYQESMELASTSNDNRDAGPKVETEKMRKLTAPLEIDDDLDSDPRNSRSYSANTRKHSSIDIDAPEALKTKSGVLSLDERATTSKIAYSSLSKDDTTMKSSMAKIENKQERRKNEPGKKYKNRDLIEGDSKRRKNTIAEYSRKNKEFAGVCSPEESSKDRVLEKRNNTGNDVLDTKNVLKENGSKMTKNRDVELGADKRLLKENGIKKKKRKKKKETDDDELSKKLSSKRKSDTKDKNKSADRQHGKTTKKDRATSSKIQGTRRPKQVKVKKSSSKSERTAGFEDKSVMSLIDKLKAYELDQHR